ncbi:cinnamyl-alcohol dehydrogenase [Ranunculus cassubicifolius]
MGEDLFWAIRGGGGSSFGVIVAWKIGLVPVPPVVTVFNVVRTGAPKLFHLWETIAHNFPEDIQVQTVVVPVVEKDESFVSITFRSLYLGTIKELLPLMESIFPELGMEAKDCEEMSWIKSTLAVNGLGGQPLEVLLNRSQPSKQFVKAKSDFVQEVISESALISIGNMMVEEDISPILIIEPMGGQLDFIPENYNAFPHRQGNLYRIQYLMQWQNGSESTKYLEAMNRIYDYMTPFVSKSPRASYLNYKDLDLGTNKDVNTRYSEAKVWGEKYFKGNFARLAFVKSMVDPENFFWDEQSIPPFCPK